MSSHAMRARRDTFRILIVLPRENCPGRAAQSTNCRSVTHSAMAPSIVKLFGFCTTSKLPERLHQFFCERLDGAGQVPRRVLQSFGGPA